MPHTHTGRDTRPIRYTRRSPCGQIPDTHRSQEQIPIRTDVQRLGQPRHMVREIQKQSEIGDQEIEVPDPDAHSAMTGALTAAYIRSKDEHDQRRTLFTPITHSTDTNNNTITGRQSPQDWPPGEYRRLIQLYQTMTTQGRPDTSQKRQYSEQTKYSSGCGTSTTNRKIIQQSPSGKSSPTPRSRHWVQSILR